MKEIKTRKINIKLSQKFKRGSNIYNIGNNNQVRLMDLIKIIEQILNKKAKKIFKPLQKGDIRQTKSSTFKLYKYIGYKSKVDIKSGVKEFLDWYLKYTKV